MRIILIGRGKMGTLIRETAAAAGDEIEAVFGRDDLGQLGRLGRVADVVMDFSRPEALPEVASYVRRTGTPLLSGTTGYTEAEKGSLFALGSAAPVLWSANYSLGVAVLARALQVIAPVLGPDFDIEITETHHSQKADAPSGTAKLLLEAVDPQHRLRPVYGREGNCGRREKDEVGIHALRGGTVAGTHTVHFFGPDEERELTRYTVNTILTYEDLKEEIDKVRRRGYAMDHEEQEMGLTCIGAPILDRNKKAVAAISLSGPTSRMNSSDLEDRIEAVCNTARDISGNF